MTFLGVVFRMTFI